ncbi:MAG: hypothetical protein ABIE03_05140, partial [Patescibacteria group bacterium]
PEKIACEYGYQMKKCFYKFPILFYDTITSAESNPIFSPGHYLPDEVIKSKTTGRIFLIHCKL